MAGTRKALLGTLFLYGYDETRHLAAGALEQAEKGIAPHAIATVRAPSGTAQAPLTRLLAPSLIRLIDHVPQARARIAEAQRHLLTAIRARNADEARTWMEKHIRDFRRGYEVAGISPDDRVEL